MSELQAPHTIESTQLSHCVPCFKEELNAEVAEQVRLPTAFDLNEPSTPTDYHSQQIIIMGGCPQIETPCE
uniref:Uncharacterized protein n=1 Tax=Knipowitschia caucasica TaxID=637954 RepID=A0AAV2J9E6_KNICA